MEKDKIKVAIVFGGRSTEHEISLLSAQNVYKSLDKDRFDPILIGIDKKGQWHYNDTARLLLDNEQNKQITTMSHPVLLSQNTSERTLVSQNSHATITKIDVLFPVLHGTFGEDGSIQGLAKLANIPIVGCGILGSSIGMDKDIMKRILRDAGIPVAKWISVRNDASSVNYESVSSELGTEVFIKPANLGSSVGVAFAKNKDDFDKGLREALKYDSKVIIEEKIKGRELECAVLGNHDPIASIPGEVEPTSEFYSYESKYLDEKGAVLHIPAQLSPDQVSRIQKLAVEVFTLLECRGMSRVDMFMTDSDQLIINEINTIPGFTDISMYPKLWEITGIPQRELISKLILLAIEEFNRTNNLKLD